jgi:hypothetical protein
MRIINRKNFLGQEQQIITGLYEKLEVVRYDNSIRTVLLRDVIESNRYGEVGEESIAGQAVTFIRGKVVKWDGSIKGFGKDGATRTELIRSTAIKSRTPMTRVTNSHYGTSTLVETKGIM